MDKIIIGIHGLSNKPKESVLKEWWHKAILEGLKKNLNKQVDVDFQLIYWADVMYDSYDPNPDAYREAEPGTLKYYKDSWLDSLGAALLDFQGDIIDSMKKIFGMDKIAEEVLERKLPDLFRYYSDNEIKNELRNRLTKAVNDNKDKKIMLVAHSMGSIVAFDVLRELDKKDTKISIEHFVTIGSPLGLPHVRYKIWEENPNVRTPNIVKKWSNLADRRDPVAVDVFLKDDYEANFNGVEVEDNLVINDWTGIHHKSYGYLRTPEFSDIAGAFI